MFGTVTLLFLILSVLIFHTSSSLNFVEFITVALILYVIMSYMFYINQVTQEQFKEEEKEEERDENENENEKENENEIENKNKNKKEKGLRLEPILEGKKKREKKEKKRKDASRDIASQDTASQEPLKTSKTSKTAQWCGFVCGEENEIIDEEVNEEINEEDEGCMIPKKNMYTICVDKAKGYVPYKTWGKIATLPATMREKILKPLQSTVPLSPREREEANDDEEGLIVDAFYVQKKRNAQKYHKLGVVIDTSKAGETQEDIDNVDLNALNNVSDKINSMNYLLFQLQKHAPDLYDTLLAKDTRSFKIEKNKRRKNNYCKS